MISIIPYSHYYWVGGPPKLSHLSGSSGGAKCLSRVRVLTTNRVQVV